MVRHLVAFGFNTALGIWHDSEKNAINLACDLVEPFRPVIDYFVYWNKDVLTNELSTDVRRRMIKLLSARVEVDGKRCTVDYAMQLLVRGLVNLLNTGDMDAMKFPRIIPTDMSEDAVI